jgi:hypothetical protein
MHLPGIVNGTTHPPNDTIFRGMGRFTSCPEGMDRGFRHLLYLTIFLKE